MNPDDPRSPIEIVRRLALWTVLCSVSAAPSFLLAANGPYNEAAMLFGVAVFIAAYTVFTSTDAFIRFRSRPFMRRTLYIGYATRLLVSAAAVPAIGPPFRGFPIGLVDMFPGIASIEIVKHLGVNVHSFAGTFLTTLVQGSFLNLILTIYMMIIYAVQRATLRPPAEPRGFDILPPRPVMPIDDPRAIRPMEQASGPSE